MVLYKEYIDCEHENEKIKFTISFNKETINWATSEPKKIGYQISAIPIKVTKKETYSIEESTVFTGFNDCLLEINRQSKKRL